MPTPRRARHAAAAAAAPLDVPVALGALTGGLLASSCCVVQLTLNSLSVGCAGLSVFKQYRGLLRLCTAALLGVLFARSGANRRTLGTLVCSLLLTFSEDAVAAVNRAGSVRAALPLLRLPPFLLVGGAGSSAGSDAVAAAAAKAAAASAAASAVKAAPAAAAAAAAPATLERWSIGVGGMRCQACAARVRGSIAALPGVRNATVALGAGTVEVWADASAGVSGAALASAISALDPTYTVAVAGRACYDAASGAPAACSAAAAAGADQPQAQAQAQPEQHQPAADGAGADAPMACGGGLIPEEEEL